MTHTLSSIVDAEKNVHFGMFPELNQVASMRETSRWRLCYSITLGTMERWVSPSKSSLTIWLLLPSLPMTEENMGQIFKMCVLACIFL